MDMIKDIFYIKGKHGGLAVEHQTWNREVMGWIPTWDVCCVFEQCKTILLVSTQDTVKLTGRINLTTRIGKK